MDKLEKAIEQATKVVRKLTILALELATLLAIVKWLILNP